MKVQDLRIGDLVNNGGHILTVHGVHGNGTVCFVVEKDQLCVDSVTVNPIPLTPEILEMNGFVRWIEGQYVKEYAPKRFLSVEYGYDNGCRTFLKQQTSPSYVRIGNTNHVHQLQHILWTLGLDAGMKV